MNSVSGVALGSMALGRWAACWGMLGQLWASHKEGEGEIAGPAEVLAQKHSKDLLNFETFIVYKYI
jgi:hypothetical protein